MLTMAEKQQSSSTEEKTIPVFAVFKNNVFLKNISIVNQQSPSKTLVKGYVETVLLGRHPDCNVVLAHPSVSRFHLRIYAKPALKQLSVSDLSSVHGTWVSDKKIEPNVEVELNEGDTFRIGKSGRVYKLYWLPSSRTRDKENPFFPQPLIGGETPQSNRKRTPYYETIVLVDFEERAEQVIDVAETSEDEEDEDWNIMLLESLDELFLETENQIHEPHEKLIPQSGDVILESSIVGLESDAQVANNVKSSFSEDTAVDNKENKILSEQFYDKSDDLGASFSKEAGAEIEQNQSPHIDIKQTDAETVTPMSKCYIPDAMEIPAENNSPQRNVIQIGEGFVTPLTKYSNTNVPENPTKNKSRQRKIKETGEGFLTPLSKNTIPNVMKTPIESKSPQRNIKQTGEGSVTPLSKYSIPTPPENQSPGRYINEIEDGFVTPMATNSIPTVVKTPTMPKRPQNYSKAKRLDSDMGETARGLIRSFHELDDTFNSFRADKENFNPNRAIPKMTSMRMRSLETGQPLRPYNISLLETSPPYSNPERNFEIQPQIILPQRGPLNSNGGGTQRMPFQTLSNDEYSVSEVRKRMWCMVVDSTCLLNRESRESLQLLRGLNWTRLIIPGIVTKEMNCLSQQCVFWERSEAYFSIQWIVDCVLNTSWWIQAQDIKDEGLIAVVTPSATAHESFSNILDYALSHRSEFMAEEEHLVLLSNDDSLKVNAMAKGILCEKVDEFRDRIVNPLSEGFMCGDSLVTRTWSSIMRGSNSLGLLLPKQVLPMGLNIILPS